MNLDQWEFDIDLFPSTAYLPEWKYPNLQIPLAGYRLNITVETFEKLDRNKQGAITLEDLKNAYNAKTNPRYISGEETEEEILTEFLEIFQTYHSSRDGKVRIEDFINYYGEISPSISSDAEFGSLLLKSFKL